MTHDEIRDSLPDLLHDRLDAGLRAAVEQHLLSCAECRAELHVLRMVAAAPLFEPTVDAVKISALIPPYGRVIERAPAQRRVFWQLGAALAAVILVAGSVVLWRGGSARITPSQNPAQIADSKTNGGATHPSAAARAGVARTPIAVAPVSKPGGTSKPQELQLAAGLEGVSDQGVAQLLRELDDLDALPSADPEPVGLSDRGGGE